MVVGLTDRFDEPLLEGMDLCWPLTDLVYKPPNVTDPCTIAAEIAKSARDTLMDWNRYDLVLAERARAHLARRISDYPGDFQKGSSLVSQGQCAISTRRTGRRSSSHGIRCHHLGQRDGLRAT
jgi:hypothetical protein